MQLKGFIKKFAFPLWPWYAFGLVALALTNYITLEIPLLAKRIVNNFDAGAQHSSLENTALLIVGLGGLTILVRAVS